MDVSKFDILKVHSVVQVPARKRENISHLSRESRKIMNSKEPSTVGYIYIYEYAVYIYIYLYAKDSMTMYEYDIYIYICTPGPQHH